MQALIIFVAIAWSQSAKDSKNFALICHTNVEKLGKLELKISHKNFMLSEFRGDKSCLLPMTRFKHYTESKTYLTEFHAQDSGCYFNGLKVFDIRGKVLNSDRIQGLKEAPDVYLEINGAFVVNKCKITSFSLGQ